MSKERREATEVRPDFAISFEHPLGCDGQNFGLAFAPGHPDRGKMAY
jgi:hypothetical protein